ncbi:MAG: hypothetical protein QM831_00950 [Kofleriaceae bacterium]
MRHLLVVSAFVAACSDDPVRVRAQLEKLTADAQDCGSFVEYDGSPDPRCDTADAQPAVDCLNAAIASGGKAIYTVLATDAQQYEQNTIYVVGDGDVQVFTDRPDGDGSTNVPFATEDATCSSPSFVLATEVCPYDSTMTEPHASLTGC